MTTTGFIYFSKFIYNDDLDYNDNFYNNKDKDLDIRNYSVKYLINMHHSLEFDNTKMYLNMFGVDKYVNMPDYDSDYDSDDDHCINNQWYNESGLTKYYEEIVKNATNIIGEWFLKCKYNPQYKYCRNILENEYNDLYVE